MSGEGVSIVTIIAIVLPAALVIVIIVLSALLIRKCKKRRRRKLMEIVKAELDNSASETISPNSFMNIRSFSPTKIGIDECDEITP